MKNSLYFLFAFLLTTSLVFSQNDDDDDFDKTFELDLLSFEESYPSIELSYGLTTVTRNPQELGALNQISAKFGTMELEDILRDDVSTGTNEMDFGYLFISYQDFGLGADADADNLFKNWIIGFGSQEGYGYKLGDNSSIILYHGDGAGISWITETENETLVNNSRPLEVFGKMARYSENMDAGVKILLFENLSVNAAYERTFIFPRYMVWYSMLSGVIQTSAQGLGGYFTKKVFKKMPKAVPIINFLIQNGISYGFYELRKEQMNWPVGQDTAPLLLDNFRLGFNFNF